MNANIRADFPIPPESWVKLQTSASESYPISQNAGTNDSPATQTSGVSVVPFVDTAPDKPFAPSAGTPSSPVSRENEESAEMWLGKHAASVIAAILVFVGLAYLGSAFLPQFPNEARIAVMFVVSGGLTALGSMLELRKRNGLTLALTGCGMASLFVSVLNLRALFGLVPEAISFAIIFALLAARVFTGGNQRICADTAEDRRYRVAVMIFTTIVAMYECTCGFPIFSYELGDLGAAMLGAGYLAGLVGIGVVLMRFARTSSASIVIFAVACTMLLMSYLYFCTPLAGEGYAWSVCCMACALVCAAIGFRMKIGGLRLYGLVLTLVCVVKLVAFDTGDLDSPERAVAYMVGGFICFAISALYNYAVKRLVV